MVSFLIRLRLSYPFNAAQIFLIAVLLWIQFVSFSDFFRHLSSLPLSIRKEDEDDDEEAAKAEERKRKEKREKTREESRLHCRYVVLDPFQRTFDIDISNE